MKSTDWNTELVTALDNWGPRAGAVPNAPRITPRRGLQAAASPASSSRPSPSLSLPRLIHSSMLGCMNAFCIFGESSEAEELKSLQMKDSVSKELSTSGSEVSCGTSQRGHGEGRGAPVSSWHGVRPLTHQPLLSTPGRFTTVHLLPSRHSSSHCVQWPLASWLFSSPQVCLPTVFHTQLCGSPIPAFLPL